MGLMAHSLLMGDTGRRRAAGILPIILSVVCALAPLPGAEKKQVTVRGYVTAVRGLMDFEIADHKIKAGSGTRLEADFSEIETDPTLSTPDPGTPAKSKKEEKKDSAPTPAVKWEDMRVGNDVEIKGELDPATNTLKAESVKVIIDDTMTKPHGEVLLEEAPKLVRRGSNWQGKIDADGYQLIVDEVTRLRVFPNAEQKKELKDSKAGKKSGPTKDSASTLEDEPSSVGINYTSPDQVKAGMVMRWGGDRLPDGTILLRRAEFRYLSDGFNIASLLEWYAGNRKQAFGLVAPKYEGKKPKDGMAFLDGKKYRVRPVIELHQYVENIGNNLLPLSIKSLPKYGPKDKNRPKDHIQFQFNAMSDKKFPGAYAHRDGTIVVSTPLLKILENEDQLAFVLAHEINHVVQRHSLREERANMKKRVIASGVSIAGRFVPGVGGVVMRMGGNLVSVAIREGYRRSLENQSDRIALETMAKAGYDPRQGPRVWELMTKNFGDGGFKTFWSSHDTNVRRRSYLMNQLTRMGQTDLQSYRPNEEAEKRFTAYKQLIDIVEAPKKKK